MATLKDGASSSSPGTKTLARTSAASNGANVGVIPPLSYETRDFPMEPSLPFGLEIFLGFREEYERAGLVLGGLLLAYFLGFWRLGWIWVFIIGAAGAGVWKRTRDAQYRRVRAQVKRELAAEKLATKYSDLEAAEWFNLLLARFWLIYEPSLSETLTNVIDGVLEWATPSFLQSLKLTTFTLGSQGPRIECVKSFPHEEQDVVQWLLHITFTPLSTDDIKIARNDRARRNVLRVSGASSAGRDANKLYGDNPPGPAAPVDSLADFPSINAAALAAGSAAGLKPAPRAQMEGDGLGYDPKNSQVVLTARMGKGLVTVPVAVEVKDVELDLQVIVRLKLIPSFPHIGSVTIMLPPYAPPPFLNFGLSALNVEVFNIPGLAEWIRSMVVGGIQSFLGGEGYTLDLASMMTATGIYGFDETVGVLVFNIFEARRLKNVDVLGGKSDPYARILIGANSQPIAGAKTQIIDNDLNPAWNEVVYVLVPASAFKDIESGADLLRVEVMDHNDAGKDASLGVTRTLKLSRWLKLLVEHELARRKPQQPEIEAKPVDGGLEDHDDSHMDNEDQTQGEKAHERELKDLKFQLPDVVLRGNDLTEAERALMMEDWGGPWGGDDVWAKLFEPGSMRPTVSDIRMEVQYLPLTKRSAVAGDQTAGNIQGMAQSSSGVLRVQLQQLKDLDGTRSLVGVLNPYVKIKFAGQDEVVHTSKIKKRTNNPIFTETFEVFVPDISTSSLIFQVWDSRDLVTDLVLGEAKVSIPEALRRKASDDWYTVSNIGGSSRSTQTSTAKARLAFSFFPVTLGENQEMAEEGGGVVKGRKPMGVARVTVKNAVKLKNAEPVGLSDPYVALSLSGKLLHRTKVIDNNLNPIWDQTYHLIIYSSNDRIEFQIFDYNDLRKDKSMGRVEMPLLALFPDLKTRSRTVSPGRDSADGPSPPTSPTASVDNFLDVANAKLATSTVLERDGIKLARSISEFGESVLVSTPLFHRKGNTGGNIPGELNFEVSYHPVIKGTFNGSISSLPGVEPAVGSDDTVPPILGSGIVRVRIQQVQKLLNNPPNVYCALLSFDGQGDEIAFETRPKSDRDPVFEDVFETFVSDLSSARFLLQVCRKFDSDRMAVPSERVLGQIDMPLDSMRDKLGKSEWFGFTGVPGAVVPQGEVRMVITVTPVDITFVEATTQGKGKLRLDIQSAEGLLGVDSDGNSDPYCRVIVDGRKVHTTKVVKDTLNPLFAESVRFDIPSRSSSKVEIEVWDWNRIKDKKLGRVLVDIKTLVPGVPVERSLPLEKSESGLPAKGKLNFAATFEEQGDTDWTKKFPRAGKIANALQRAMSSDGTGKDVVTVKVPPSQGTGSAKADSSESHTQTESSGKPSQTFEAPATLVSPPTPITVVDSTAEDVSDANELLHASSASQLDTSVNRSRSNSLLSVSTNAGSELPRELSGGNCTVHVEGASAVPKKGDSLPDTYVKIARGGHNVVRSKIVKKSISPAWNESGTVRLRDREPCTFDIEVKSHRLLDSDVIGTAKFDLRKHLHDESDKWTKEGAWVWDGTLALDTGILLRFGVVFQPGSAPPSPATSESKLSNGGLFHLRRSASNRHAVDDT